MDNLGEGMVFIMQGIKKILGGIGLMVFALCCAFIGQDIVSPVIGVLSLVLPVIGLGLVIEGMVSKR